MKWTTLTFYIIHLMASFNLLRAITVFTGKKKKANSVDYQAAPEWNWEPSEVNGERKNMSKLQSQERTGGPNGRG